MKFPFLAYARRCRMAIQIGSLWQVDRLINRKKKFDDGLDHKTGCASQNVNLFCLLYCVIEQGNDFSSKNNSHGEQSGRLPEDVDRKL